MSSHADALEREAEGRECSSRRSWGIFPLAVVAAIAALTAGLFLLTWAKVILPTPVGGSPPPFWFLFPLGFVLFWLLVVSLVRPWRWWGGYGPGYYGAPGADPENEVRLRYARGDITAAQMAELLGHLREHPAPPLRESGR